MTKAEIIAIALPCLYALATVIAAKYPKSKVGVVCAIVALAIRHDVKPKE